MEMFIHIALFLFGVFLIWNGLNSLKKLKENNQKWQEIGILSHSFDNELKEEYEEVAEYVKYINKYFPLIMKIQFIIGVLCVLGSFILFSNFLNSFYMDLSFIGHISFVLLFIPFAVLVITHFSYFDFFDVFLNSLVSCNKFFKLHINYFSLIYKYRKEISLSNNLNVYNYQDNFNLNYLIEKKKKGYYKTGVKVFSLELLSPIFLLMFYIGLFLFFLAFIFDKNFYQKIISF
ncbi:MAG: hypothetical protein IKZ88_02520 [Neisseriaceae bacterium]|nr:hypothetical protein [Neisseriaceae bacterium]